MPERKSTRKVNSQEVQGDDSFVVLHRITVGERRALESAQSQAEAKGEKFDVEQYGIDVLTRHLVAWNWVNDAGDPLPLPNADATVIDRLTDEELKFLVNAFREPVTDPKS